LEANPDHPDALHLRGVLALQAGHGDEAIRFIERSVELNPNNADALNNLGSRLIQIQ
jgi:Flp pilus assembly protein TadD